MKLFHERLLKAMQDNALTQTALAARTGMDLTSVCHLVHGDRAPALSTLSRLLVALPNTNARWLITGKEKA